MKKRPFSLISFPYACLLVYWFLFALTGLLTELVLPPNLLFKKDGRIAIADFICFYEAGKIALQNAFQNISLYDFKLQLNELNSIIAPEKSEIVFAIPYPPPFYFSFMPFALLSLPNAFRLWIGLSLTFGISALTALLKARKKFNALSIFIFLCAAFVSIPSQITLSIGQLVWCNLGLLSCFALFSMKKREIIAGLFLALSLLKPTLALFVFVYSVAARKWKTVITTLISYSIFALISVICFGLKSCLDYLPYLAAATKSPLFFGLALESQANLHGMLAMFLPRNIASLIAYVGFVMGLGIVCFIADKVRQQEGEAASVLWRWGLALTLVICLFFSPHAHFPDCLLLALSAALTLPMVSFANAIKMKGAAAVWTLTLTCYSLIGFFVLIAGSFLYQVKPVVLFLLNGTLLISGFIHFKNIQTRKTLEDGSAFLPADESDSNLV